MKTLSTSAHVLVMLPLMLVVAGAAAAQQTPVTGQMMGQGSATMPASVSPAPVPAQVVAAPSARSYSSLSANTRSQATAAPAARADGAAYSATPRAVEPPPHVTVVGETTRSLLQMQADGAQAGKHLPMLGAEASLSYDRYMKSFSHDIPEFYKTAVGKDSNGNAGGE